MEEWNVLWEEKGIFQADPDERPKKFITAAFPYPNSPQHIGHARTYTVTDAYVRYWRLRGFNVLFPMGFHVTGTPVLAMAKRIRRGEEELLRIFTEIYGIPEEVARSLDTPEKIVGYFSKEIEEGMKEMGFSIDWRRKFYTSDPEFNAFIQWQFRKLAEGGLLKKGKHYVAWCPSCGNAVGAHDTKGDKDPEVEEVIVLLFKGGEMTFPALTYRPETVFGVTNIWINPEADYVITGEGLVLSKEAWEDLKHQMEIGEVRERVKGKDLVGKEVVSPYGEKVKVLPAKFVDPLVGTGVVMSVPAHAPWDYVEAKNFGIQPKVIIHTPGIDGIPSEFALSKEGGHAEKATKFLYKEEFHQGKMSEGPYSGLPVSEAKEKVAEELKKKGLAFSLRIIANGPVYCRCGARCVVKEVADQWFIDYGNPKWKEKARRCLKEMSILPEKTREKYEYTIGWLKEKPCTREQGLGTPFPFDPSKIIEPLSDSTIYMAFYTIAHKVKGRKLTDEFFDYVFLGKGEPKEDWEELRKEFLYWYPLDSRHSGADLIHNHLTFFIFNHVAVFPEELWPLQIVTNGFVLMEGKKMSKSLGNILPLRKAIRKYGADVVRLAVLSGADLDSDTDFSDAVARGISNRLQFFRELVGKSSEGPSPVDAWILSKFYRRISAYHERFERLALREILQELFYGLYSDLVRYFKRGGKGAPLREILEQWAIYMSPFAPYTCEEIWRALGKKEFVKESEFVSLARFPEVSPKIDEEAERVEEYLERVREDAILLKNLLKKEVKFLKVIYADEEERQILEEGKDYLEREIGVKIFLEAAKDSSEEKAKRARPGKPALVFS